MTSALIADDVARNREAVDEEFLIGAENESEGKNMIIIAKTSKGSMLRVPVHQLQAVPAIP